MRSALALLLTVMMAGGCASDAALSAARGSPGRYQPVEVVSAERAWRMPDGSLGVCAMMRMAAGGWSAGEFVQPAAFTAAIPGPVSAATIALPANAWQRRMPAGEGGFRSGECESEVPRDACLLGVHLDARTLRVTDSAGGVVATLELREKKRVANAAFWPLVPLGYVGDVALALVAIPATIVVVAVVAPFALLAAAFADDPPLRPDPPLPAPCPLS